MLVKDERNHLLVYLMVEYKVEQADLRKKNRIGLTNMVFGFVAFVSNNQLFF